MQQNSNSPGQIKLWIPSNQQSNNTRTKLLPQSGGGGDASFQIDSRSKKRMTKGASKAKTKRIMSKPRPHQPVKERRMARNRKAAQAKRAMDRRKRKVHTPPQSSPQFSPEKSSTPRFSERHLGFFDNWMNDEEFDDTDDEF